LLYIVEVSWIPFDDCNQPLKALPIIRDSLSKIPIEEVKIPSTIEDEVIQVAEQDYGLICPSSGQLVPLKAFHIRAQLVDITAEVNQMIFFFFFFKFLFPGCSLSSLS
jgi:hypothetical protein